MVCDLKCYETNEWYLACWRGATIVRFLGFPVLFAWPVIDICPTKSSFINFEGITPPTPSKSYAPACRRKPKYPGKTHNFWQSIYTIFFWRQLLNHIETLLRKASGLTLPPETHTHIPPRVSKGGGGGMEPFDSGTPHCNIKQGTFSNLGGKSSYLVLTNIIHYYS